MNNRITIDKIDGSWYCFLTEYDSLPFNHFKDNILKTIKSETYSDLIKKISEAGIFDLINKNQ